MRADSNHGGADEHDRKHKRWQDPYDETGSKRTTPHRMWMEYERAYIKQHFIDHKDMTIKQLCVKLGGVTKNALYNQIQYIRARSKLLPQE